MNLQTILFGAYTPPPVSAIHRHYHFSFSQVKMKQDEIKPVVQKEKRQPSDDKVYAEIKLRPGISVDELTKYTKLAPATIYKSICSLYKENLIYSKKQPMKRQLQNGGTYIKLFWAMK